LPYLATGNPHKKEELSRILHPHTILIPPDLGISFDADETGSTYLENALIKANALHQFSDLPVFGDDTGLFVDALGGEPGIFSARYAGENATYEDNVNQLLERMHHVPETRRTARFETVIAVVWSGGIHVVRGHVNGRILFARDRGTHGFGYDPVFVPEGENVPFSALSLERKNQLSHRGQALDRLETWLLTQIVRRMPSLSNTHSTTPPSDSRKRSFSVPSSDAWCLTIVEENS